MEIRCKRQQLIPSLIYQHSWDEHPSSTCLLLPQDRCPWCHAVFSVKFTWHPAVNRLM